MAEKERGEQRQAAQAETVSKEEGLLDRIVSEGRMARDESQKEYARDLIGEFVKQVMQGAMVVSKDTELMINARIAQLDSFQSG
jgi:type VI secretion system protein ImpC